jgi:cation:H+ antiporter
MLENIGLMAAGLAILVFGADWLVKGASRLAIAAGIAPLVVGLTIVAFGTSAPELAVSVTSAYSGANDIAVANVVGSNIFNVLFILGVSALVAPLIVHQQLVRMDVPIMIGVSVLLFVLGADGTLNLWDSALLTSLILAYTVFLIVEARGEKNPEIVAEYAEEVADAGGTEKSPMAMNIALIVVGLAALVYGAGLLVDGAISMAKALGVSEVIIGLTIVAAGTSLPELATSAVAAFKGERDIAIGNVVGSCIFNICSVLGFSGIASLGALTVAPNMIEADIPLMIMVALVCLPFFRAGYTVTRTNGAVFLMAYVLYVTFLVLKETQHEALPMFSTLMFSVLLPAVIVGTVIVSVLALREEESSRQKP